MELYMELNMELNMELYIELYMELSMENLHGSLTELNMNKTIMRF